MQSSMLTIYIHKHGSQLLSDQRIHDIPESIPPKQFEEYIELQKSQIQRSKDEIEELQQRILNQKNNLDIALNQFSSFK
jgi:hypothetical protein